VSSIAFGQPGGAIAPWSILITATMKPNYRRCVSCRRAAPKEDFWRIVRVYPAQRVELDQGMGRSAYLCRNLSCLQAAQKKNRLGRSLKANVTPETYHLLHQRLAHLNQNEPEELSPKMD
jgi:uncharacterized protein